MSGPTNVLATSLKRAVFGKHVLPDLPYAYDALEPIIARDIMMLHHKKHHQSYVTNLNVAEERLELAIKNCDTTTMLALGPALKFNGGGHINHTIFWNNLTPQSTKPGPKLVDEVSKSFGNFDGMKQALTTATVGIQGSGWGWLGYDKLSNQLKVATCANQDPLEATTGLVPLLGIDVWEHAYYLQYKNVRGDYVNAIWDIINWDDIEERLENIAELNN